MPPVRRSRLLWHDIIESLLGFEIIDEKDKVDDMQQYALERWKERQRKYKMLKDMTP